MKNTTLRRIIVLLCAACAVVLTAVFIFSACDSRLRTVTFRIESDKISSPVKIALLTDLHSCEYGENQSELLDAVYSAFPDIVLLGGDIFDDKMPHDNALFTVQQLAALYPCFYVSGNHEYWGNEIDRIKQMTDDAGATVLEGDCVQFEIGGQSINICGVDDPTYIGERRMRIQLSRAEHAADKQSFTLLLSHRPELTELYGEYDFDLVLSGHAHGGQWRIPGLLNGLFAPDQGLFPKYAGGKYTFDGWSMIVSRGLARESTALPRIFNRPELVIIELV